MAPRRSAAPRRRGRTPPPPHLALFRRRLADQAAFVAKAEALRGHLDRIDDAIARLLVDDRFIELLRRQGLDNAPRALIASVHAAPGAQRSDLRVERSGGPSNKEVTVHRRVLLMARICDRATVLLDGRPCPFDTFKVLRRFTGDGQVAAVELMIAHGDFSCHFAWGILRATPSEDRAAPRRAYRVHVPVDRVLSRLRQKLQCLGPKAAGLRLTYGGDARRLVVLRGYFGKFLADAQVVGWLARYHSAELGAIQEVVEYGSVLMVPSGDWTLAAR